MSYSPRSSGCLEEELACTDQGVWHPSHTRQSCCEATCKRSKRRCRNRGKYEWLTGSLLINTIQPPHILKAKLCGIHDKEASESFCTIYDTLPAATVNLVVGVMVKHVTGLSMSDHAQLSNVENPDMFQNAYEKAEGVHHKIEVIKRFVRSSVSDIPRRFTSNNSDSD
jgi:hypothetical protein